MILGAMKCGTTSLAHILSTHPDIGFSIPKETDFFVDSPSWKEELANYHSFFPKQEKKLYGEGSTCYTKYPRFNLEIWEDIYQYNSTMKFIYMMRHPVDRLISHYMHLFEMGYLETSIEQAIVYKAELINVSRYYMQIKPYIDRFGKDNVLFVDFDEFTEEPNKVMQSVSDFLEISSSAYKIKDFKKVHANKSIGGHPKKHKKYYQPQGLYKYIRNHYPKLWEKITDNTKRTFTQKVSLDDKHRRIVINMVEQDICNMEELWGRDLSKWLK